MNYSAEEQEEKESKIYLNWINMCLTTNTPPTPPIQDLSDLNDGVTWVLLLEACEKKANLFIWSQEPRTIYHRIENIESVITFIRKSYPNRALAGLSGDMFIEEVQRKFVLSLCWTFISIYQIARITKLHKNTERKKKIDEQGGTGDLPPEISVEEVHDESTEDKLAIKLIMAMINERISAADPSQKKISKLRELFSNKKLFYLFLSNYISELKVEEYNKYENMSDKEYFNKMFDLSQDKLGIPVLLDPDTVSSVKDSKALMIYLSLFKALDIKKQVKPKAGDDKTLPKKKFSLNSIFDSCGFEQTNKELNALEDKNIQGFLSEFEPTGIKDKVDNLNDLFSSTSLVDTQNQGQSEGHLFENDEEKQKAIAILNTLRRVYLELLTTEQAYVGKIGQLQMNVVVPLNSLPNTKLEFLNKDVMRYFTILYELNNKFLGDLKKAYPNKKEPLKTQPSQFTIDMSHELAISKLLSSYAQFFKSYSNYAAKQNNITNDIYNVKNKPTSYPELAAIIDKASQTLTQGLIESYLISPIQRIGRYVLLAKEMLKQTTKLCDILKDKQVSAPDSNSKLQEFLRNINLLKEVLTKAVKELSNTGSAIDKYVLDESKKQAILEIDRMVYGKEHFSKPARELFKKGFMFKISETGDLKYLFILFNDLIVYGKLVNGKLIVHKQIPVNSSFHAKPLPDSLNEPKNRIEIYNSVKSFIAYPPTYKEHKEWLSVLKRAEDLQLEKAGGVKGFAITPLKVKTSISRTGKFKCKVCSRSKFDPGENLLGCVSCSRNVCKNCLIDPKLLNSDKHINFCKECYIERQERERQLNIKKAQEDIAQKQMVENQIRIENQIRERNERDRRQVEMDRLHAQQMEVIKKQQYDRSMAELERRRKEEEYRAAQLREQQMLQQQRMQQQQQYSMPNPSYPPQPQYQQNYGNYTPGVTQPGYNQTYMMNMNAGVNDNKTYLCPFCNTLFRKLDSTAKFVFCSNCKNLLNT
eukprot:GAHX01000381.1.p1 GENE.GAHX01000381.1~~GAHX01000381.1.p1  ORF type:complete len:983 (+),score=210.06 GAHX01000381.1:45-2993(+)